MRNRHMLLAVVCVLGTSISACGDSSQAVTAPAGPRFNGSSFGSGNYVDGSGDTVGTVSTESTDSTTTARNGSVLGSGN